MPTSDPASAAALRFAAESDPGARAGNEDHLAFGHAGSLGHFAVLADGAGGHLRGAEASRLAVESFEGRLRAGLPLAFKPAIMTALVHEAHQALVSRQGDEPHARRMHTTFVALWIDARARFALWSHVGDSRLYRFRLGRAQLLTSDDSVVQQMLTAGLISEADARRHPQRNQLLAALGIEGRLEPHTVAEPIELREGDAFLLCSDGWWEHFDGPAMAAALLRAPSPQGWLAEMAASVRAAASPRQDNFSAVAVWLGQPGEITVSPWLGAAGGAAPR